jgi:hypothetical protein
MWPLGRSADTKPVSIVKENSARITRILLVAICAFGVGTSSADAGYYVSKSLARKQVKKFARAHVTRALDGLPIESVSSGPCIRESATSLWCRWVVRGYYVDAYEVDTTYRDYVCWGGAFTYVKRGLLYARSDRSGKCSGLGGLAPS